MMTEVNAIVLAAGLGTRLRPLTELMPKPLIPVANVPLLENVLLNLTAAGINKIAINTHYLAEQMDAFVCKSIFSNQVKLFHEPKILGTGGPVINARELLSETPFFLLHNSDILTDMDLRQLCETHRRSRNKVTMALIDGPENKVRLTADGRIHDILDKLDRCPAQSRKLTYSGVMALSTDIFEWLPSTVCNCSIITAVLKMMENEPDAVGAFLPEKIYWNDLGTLPQYFQAHQDIIEHKITLKQFDVTDKRVCGHGSFISPKSKLSGFLAAGRNCVINDGANVENCILLDNTTVKTGQSCRNQIITRSGTVHRDYNELKNLNILKAAVKGNLEINSLPEAGSARCFYRIVTPERRAVLVLSDQSDKDFERFVYYGRYMNGKSFPTPDVYEYCSEEYSVLVEDLGNDTLYDKVKNAASRNEIIALYHAVIDRLIDFQKRGTELFSRPDAPALRNFDYDYLRWESNYFLTEFIDKYLKFKLSPAGRHALNEAFNRLAELVDAQPKYLIHRDFQSQNIMLTGSQDAKAGRSIEPRFVDYQGMRLGSPGYDIVALLNDPYVELDIDLRSELFEYYIAQAEKYISGDLESYILSAWMQRSMQALGAFSFLALEKNKQQYLQYIPRGVTLLAEGVKKFEHKFSFPLSNLHSILMSKNN